jgi:hypothetical protein
VGIGSQLFLNLPDSETIQARKNANDARAADDDDNEGGVQTDPDADRSAPAASDAEVEE